MKSTRKAFVLLLATVVLAALPVLAATLFSDDFNRTDADLLGGNWVERGFGWTGTDFDIITNRVQLITIGVVHNTTALGTADYTVQAIVNPATGATSHGVCGRRVNNGANDSDSYSALINETTNAVLLYKRVGGTSTQLQSYANTITAGTDYTVKLSMQGTTIKAFLNGVEQTPSVTDSSLSAAGDACINALEGNAVGTRWDDFLVEDFVAGGVARRRILK